MICFSEEQRILVTGASSGIGRAIALLLNSLGATVIANGRDVERLTALKAGAAKPETLHLAPHDLTENMEGISTWFASLRKIHGPFWGLAHAAGLPLLLPVQAYDLEKARAHFDINFHVPMLLAKAFSDRRNSCQGGAALFIASTAALYPDKGQCIYGAAKSALITAAKVMSLEFVSRGLRVHCIAPGFVQTPMVDLTKQYMNDTYEREVALYPLGLGTPEDIANMAALLLSDKARWMTGQTIVMDGGRY